MPVKVLQIINSFSIAGAELMAKRLAIGYDPGRITCDILSISRGPSTDTERIFLSGLDEVGIGHHCLDKRPGLKDLRTVARLARRTRAERYDVVHAHCQSPSYYGRLAAAAVPSARAMVTVHLPMTEAEVRVEKAFARITALYVACSSEIVPDLRDRCGLRASKITRILNGVGGNRTQGVTESREEIRQAYGVPVDEPVALVLARIGPQKAQLDVLEALTHAGTHLPRLRVWFVGDDRLAPDYAQRVREFIHLHDLDSRVKLLGVVSDDEIGRLMKAADLFLLPSEAEGLSVAILEALGAGMPTVVSDLPNNREATDNGRVARLVPPHNVPELARTLDALLADLGAMKELGREAAHFVRSTFGFERVVEEYSSAYEMLARRR